MTIRPGNFKKYTKAQLQLVVGPLSGWTPSRGAVRNYKLRKFNSNGLRGRQDV